MTPEQLAAIEARAKAATEGPWGVNSKDFGNRARAALEAKP